MFEPKTHQLVWPIEDEQKQPIQTIQIQPITMGQHRNLSKTHKADDTKLLRACIIESTSLTETWLKQLVTPDYTSVQNQVLELINTTASQLMEDEFDNAIPALLIPIQGDDGQEKTSYKLRPPTVATTDLMDTYSNEWERTIFISSSCSGFSQAELERLSLPDWNQLQERLIDFLEQPADYFRPKTSKS